MNILSLIIKREFIAKVRNKSFIVMTFLSPLLLLGMSILIGVLANINKGEIKKVAIHDKAGILKEDFKNNKEIKYTDLSQMPFDLAKKTASKDFEGLIYIPKVSNSKDLINKVEYISDESPNLEFVANIEKVVDTHLTKENLQSLGFDSNKIEKAKVESELHITKFSGEEGLKYLNEIKIFFGGAFGYLIMMFIIIYGNFVMRSVIEEKTSRIIEVIISSVKPYQLMMGKIIGNSLAGILQFAIWVVLGLLLLFGSSMFLGNSVNAVHDTMQQLPSQAGNIASMIEKINLYYNEIPVLTTLVFFLIYFIGGYFLYSSLYAAIGAAVDSETDSQQFLLPIIMPLMLGIYVGFFTVVNDPHGTVATLFSMIPFTSPIVMLMRIPFGVPIWQLVVSITLLFGTFLGVVWFASKIYRVGILMYGKKPTWKELYKWLKY
ncbi:MULTISPECIES: ABC transporter permease [Flavobacterium]|uniref:ABC transporter permease n=3 Tax=Flavobacterium TaxID=237 RepID=A0AA94EXT6_9FLAO|nr:MULTISPECIES: ABC transporter permease [Flavobacterium]OXA82992.1 ABC transporter permease [Flavobacterium columnare] [Flavobacterium columnare NBRC 100251 = ATCC 23463]AMA49384.1 ABC transporter permease [Flavobacterium covae]AND63089.1 ABC transporter permease [Flavobacterium covae]MCH4828663.1 ABC transporter permease [Flavobacterium columnare]MCH4831916.1 ABC transporter permease [Flavobacterium columnare]